MAKKKKWNKPKLIILVRDRPEEAVLVVCKLWGLFGGPSTPMDCLNASGTGPCVSDTLT
jgi:hypothetical protein